MEKISIILKHQDGQLEELPIAVPITTGAIKDEIAAGGYFGVLKAGQVSKITEENGTEWVAGQLHCPKENTVLNVVIKPLPTITEMQTPIKEVSNVTDKKSSVSVSALYHRRPTKTKK